MRGGADSLLPSIALGRPARAVPSLDRHGHVTPAADADAVDTASAAASAAASSLRTVASDEGPPAPYVGSGLVTGVLAPDDPALFGASSSSDTAS